MTSGDEPVRRDTPHTRPTETAREPALERAVAQLRKIARVGERLHQ